MGQSSSTQNGRPERIATVLATVLTLVFLRILKKKQTSDGTNVVKKITAALTGVDPLSLVVLTLLGRYLVTRLQWFVGLHPPSYKSRLHWQFELGSGVLTALDAGFFSAYNVKPLWLREVLSLLLSVYYMFHIEDATIITDKFRKAVDVYALRYSWEKSGQSAALRFITGLTKPKTKTIKKLSIPRSGNGKLEPMEVYVFYDGPEEELADNHEVIVHYHGGGFMSMSPAIHDDYLSVWATQIKKPIVSINYKKAPEYKYPYAVDECFDLYQQIVASKGQVVGLSGSKHVSVIVTGDSAGGNLSATTTLKALTSNVPAPTAVLMTYPALNMSPGFWAPKTPSNGNKLLSGTPIAKVDDRILDSSIFKASSKAYVKETDEPATDMFLSPVAAPKELLQKFPPVYINVGNQDPLYDDTLHFSKLLLEAKTGKSVSVIENNLFVSEDLTVVTIDGFSHGYLHMMGFAPDVRKIVQQSGKWMQSRFSQHKADFYV